jgi:hypothetical protein
MFKPAMFLLGACVKGIVGDDAFRMARIWIHTITKRLDFLSLYRMGFWTEGIVDKCKYKRNYLYNSTVTSHVQWGN